MTSTVDHEVEPAGSRGRVPSAWDLARGALALVVVGGWLGVFLAGSFAGSFATLDEQLRAGEVDVVQVEADLVLRPPGAQDYQSRQVVGVRWFDGMVHRQAQLVVRVPGEDRIRSDGTPVISQDPGTWFEETYGVRVERADLRSDYSLRPPFMPEIGTSSYALPGFLLVGSLGVLVVLIAGPEPWRATRWAWFWLIGNPIGTLAFLLVSGHTPGIPDPPPGARRLTGGWAFLLSFALTAITAGAVSLLGELV